MSRKLKFRPRITRVKLNPEQAVLSCSCYDGSGLGSWSGTMSYYEYGGANKFCRFVGAPPFTKSVVGEKRSSYIIGDCFQRMNDGAPNS